LLKNSNLIYKSSMDSLKIAIAGLGTVGLGVLRILTDKAASLESKIGRKIEVVAVSSRTKKPTPSGIKWLDNPVDLAATNADVIIELIGGEEGVAKELAIKTLSNKKHLITANKAMIAAHGKELNDLAEKNGVMLMFEAAVAGGIPVIKAIRESLVANEVSSISGIINGTCNYILSTMLQTRGSFGDVLKEAQRLGYAETPPDLDVNGDDTAHKLAILASLCFGNSVNKNDIIMHGITQVSLADIDIANQFGYRIKLVGNATLAGNQITQVVMPSLCKLGSQLSLTDGVLNCVEIVGDEVDRLSFIGRGAGQNATASSVIADLADVAKACSMPKNVIHKDFIYSDDFSGKFYIRIFVEDKTGVLAEITKVLSSNNISVDQLMQSQVEEGTAIAIITHDTSYKNAFATSSLLAKEGFAKSIPSIMRVLA
jgi:homoserine dehydrogenase